VRGVRLAFCVSPRPRWDLLLLCCCGVVVVVGVVCTRAKSGSGKKSCPASPALAGPLFLVGPTLPYCTVLRRSTPGCSFSSNDKEKNNNTVSVTRRLFWRKICKSFIYLACFWSLHIVTAFDISITLPVTYSYYRNSLCSLASPHRSRPSPVKNFFYRPSQHADTQRIQ
jgi:hypothetical protein